MHSFFPTSRDMASLPIRSLTSLGNEGLICKRRAHTINVFTPFRLNLLFNVNSSNKATFGLAPSSRSKSPPIFTFTATKPNI